MHHVVVVGGRLTGIAAYIQLVSRLPRGSQITIIDPDEADYPAVFGDPAPQLLCNTSAHIGSLVAEEANDLLDFLPAGIDPHGVPRGVMGEYAAARFARFRQRATLRWIRTDLVRARVTAIRARANGYQVVTTAGDVHDVTDVVLAMGPGPARKVAGAGSVSPYPSSALMSQRPDRALVVGMGSAGIDAALMLASSGVQVDMASRSGYFPAVRTRTLRSRHLRPPAHHRTLNLQETLEAYAGTDRAHSCFANWQPSGDPVEQLVRDIDASAPELSPWQDGLADVVYLLGSRPMTFTDPPEFVWRHLTSVMRATATSLLALIQQGLVRPVPLQSADVGQYPMVVSAIGTETYPIFAGDDGLVFGRQGERMQPLRALDEDLRVVLPGRTSPERIWAIGPTAGLARVTSSALCVAVAQAREVADHIAFGSEAARLEDTQEIEQIAS